MEQVAAGFFTACVMLALVVFVAVKIAAAWHRLVNNLRGGPAPAPAGAPRGTGPGIIFYRSSNGRSDYQFRIQRTANGSYRVYVLDHPSYGSRDTNDLITHLLRDGQGSYICFTGRIENMEQARNLAATWADKTEDYILHGTRF
jgi:hypothetical protein